MTNDIKEHLSALLDDELTPGAFGVLEQIPESEELRRSWDSYSLIGDVIRGEGLRYAAMGISGQVRDQLASEAPIVAAPRDSKAARRPAERWLKPVAGAAIAASVAAVTVLTFNNFSATGSNSGPVRVATAPVPVSGDTQRGTRWKNLDESKVESKLNRFLVNHNEYAASAGLGVMPYTTFVGYDGGSNRP